MRQRRPLKLSDRYLEDHCELRVRFAEVDALRVVWHGHYVAYFEEGRTAFGRRYAFSYQDILQAGFVAPLVQLSLDYRRPARYDDLLQVRTRMHYDPAARIVFAYEITDSDGKVLVTGQSAQVFTDRDGNLLLTRPAFFDAFWERSR